jgi:XTP/dITP diphosphohydrolase
MLAGLDVELHSLFDYPDIPEITEDGHSYLENALKKAKAVSGYTGEMVLADDSGLEVDILNGAPGIYSSRYSGDDATDEGNVKMLLKKLQGVSPKERGASFHCVLVLNKPDGTHEVFTGRWEGRIHDIKNIISHRGQAFAKFKERLAAGF